MNHILGFISFEILADVDDFFKVIGPLFIFGFYILAALAKGWSKSSRQKTEEEMSPELKKSIQDRRRKIHDRQIGKITHRPEPPGHTRPQEQPVRFEPSVMHPEPTRPVQRAHPVYPVQKTPQRRPMSAKIRQPRYAPEKPTAVKIEPPKLYPEHRKEKFSPAKASSRQPETTFIRMLRQPQNLRNAIILKEILDKPLALRDS